ncbi:hypothetical protein TCAL_13781 [Tigriopus californicus]|uniref:DUF659 domain-containing protein n=1 Tax=Tigriopus californicus TaxID=6832 RepID=A0A553NS49_TIGCA|nr:hypothetical protein TCAL_13781 [Tigriopus californicus]|eukprot:TCALIF_13781-PA protein Name:"Similar to Zbed4 Zinc finger BED domain-containing protein 4 (Mus musculus)" AED:0.11 eAED:0.11 QI:347/0.33/0.25/1/0.66/0.5/4/0/386
MGSVPVESYSRYSANKVRLDRALVTLIAQDLQPVSIVEDKGFKSFCLAMDPRFQRRHTSELLAKNLQQVLKRKKLLAKVVAYVTDNAANIVKATIIINVKYLPCYAHSLNLVANASLMSNARVITLKNQASSIVELTKRSGQAAEILEAVQKKLGTLRPERLIQNVHTRWNSTCEMLERIQELRDPITLFLNDPIISPKVDNISAHSWTILDETVEVLSLLYEATIELSGDKKPTGSKASPITNMLMDQYRSFMIASAMGSVKHTLAATVLQQLERRFGKVEQIPELALGTLLDPRLKGRCFRNDTDKLAAIHTMSNELEILHDNLQQKRSDAPCGTHLTIRSPIKEPRSKLLPLKRLPLLFLYTWRFLANQAALIPSSNGGKLKA